MDILDFAKLMNASKTGETFGLDQADLHAEIQKRAEKSRRPGQSAQQAYRDVLLTEEGQELYGAMKRAPRQAAQDLPVKAKPEPLGPAAAALNRLARAMAKDKGISFERAYVRIYENADNDTDPDRAELVRRVKAEEREQTNRVAASRWPIERANQEFQRDWSLGRERGSGRL